MNSILVILAGDADEPTLPETLARGIAEAGIAQVASARCDTMVRELQARAPSCALIHLELPTPDLRAALQAWPDGPPCPVAMASAALDGAGHAELAALGVQAWTPIDALDGPALAALLARAQVRWQREVALRRELADLRTRLDERKWVDRAKGLLMAARDIGEDEAFGLLRGTAMHANLRLGEVSRSVVEAAQWADALNRAGQLRMLSQRLVRLSAQLAIGLDLRQARTLRMQSIERVQHNLDRLGALALGDAAARSHADARRAWQALADALAARPSLQGLAGIDARAETFLGAAEALADALEQCAQRRALRMVNICGRQRMRAQRLAKDALLAALAPAGADAARERLVPTINDFEVALLELERAPLSSPEIRSALAAARDDWLRLVHGVRELDSADGRAALVRASEALLQTFEGLTAGYEHSLQIIMS